MRFEGKRFFILEDDVTNLAVISAVLKRDGAELFFDTWGTASEVQIVSFLPIDLIILDLMLPQGVSGYDVFDRIKATPELAEIPIIVVTASDPGVEMIRAREKGFDGYLSKPIRAKTFPIAIEMVLNGQQVWEDLE